MLAGATVKSVWGELERERKKEYKVAILQHVSRDALRKKR